MIDLLHRGAPILRTEDGTAYDLLAEAAPIRINTESGIRYAADLRGLDVTLIEGWEERLKSWHDKRPFAGVDLSYAQLAGARLTRLPLQGAILFRANLRKATLRHVDLSDADLTKADLSDADLRSSQLDDTYFGYVSYTEDSWLGRGTLLLHETSLQRARYVDPLLLRYANDQSYLYVLKYRNRRRPHVRLMIFLWWLTSNFGRSLLLWTAWCLLLIMAFGIAFSAGSAQISIPPELQGKVLTPFYLSVSTFMTLGIGDVRPSSTLGMVLVMLEVVLGYLMFGVLLSIMANKIARRA